MAFSWPSGVGTKDCSGSGTHCVVGASQPGPMPERITWERWASLLPVLPSHNGGGSRPVLKALLFLWVLSPSCGAHMWAQWPGIKCLNKGHLQKCHSQVCTMWPFPIGRRQSGWGIQQMTAKTGSVILCKIWNLLWSFTRCSETYTVLLFLLNISWFIISTCFPNYCIYSVGKVRASFPITNPWNQPDVFPLAT